MVVLRGSASCTFGSLWIIVGHRVFYKYPLFIDYRLFSREILNDCSLNTIKVQKDDIIILSSDGLWDVIKSYQLRETVKHNSNRVKKRT